MSEKRREGEREKDGGGEREREGWRYPDQPSPFHSAMITKEVLM